MSGLDGVALVTGGGRGIGAAIARELAAAGMRVGVSGRSAAPLAEIAAATGGLALPGDVAREEDVAGWVARVEQELGPIDLLVANAGLTEPPGPLWERAAADWRRVVEVNLLGTFLCLHAVLPGMVARGRGRVVVVSSNAAFYPIAETGLPTFSAYMSSKAAAVRLVEAAAADARPHGVGVFAVSPGLVHTQLTDEIGIFADRPEEEWTPPERTAELVAFIATGALDALSGRYLHARADDWRTLPERAGAIVADDLLALRLRR